MYMLHTHSRAACKSTWICTDQQNEASPEGGKGVPYRRQCLTIHPPAELAGSGVPNCLANMDSRPFYKVLLLHTIHPNSMLLNAVYTETQGLPCEHEAPNSAAESHLPDASS